MLAKVSNDFDDASTITFSIVKYVDISHLLDYTPSDKHAGHSSAPAPTEQEVLNFDGVDENCLPTLGSQMHAHHRGQGTRKSSCGTAVQGNS